MILCQYWNIYLKLQHIITMSNQSDYLNKEHGHNADLKVESETQLSSCDINTINENIDHASTILIAEDVLSNFLLLKKILEKDYHILHALDGQEAIDMFHKYSPDLILMDIKMPNLDGWEATHIIRQHSPNIPIIAQTAFAYDTDKEKAITFGFNDFITKPISISLLRQTLKKYI